MNTADGRDNDAVAPETSAKPNDVAPVSSTSKGLVERVNDLDQFFLGAPQAGLSIQRITRLVQEVGLEEQDLPVLIDRVLAMESLRERILAAEQAVYCHASNLLQATCILDAVEQEVLGSENSNDTVVSRIEEVELQLGLRASLND